MHMMEVSTPMLRSVLAMMLRIRRAEERIGELVEAREVRCPCHLYIGQEAIAAGVCAALETADYVWGAHRSHGHYLAKGGNMNGMFAEIFGKSTGCAHGRGGSMHLIAPEVGIFGTVPLVAATIPIAVGAALAFQLRHVPNVSVAFFGDGAVEEGCFHEAVNLAAVYHLPAIFVCENNFYSSHLSLLERRAKDNIYQSGPAHGIPGIRLDGNDVLEVYHHASEAVRRARDGAGPTLLECRTYRWRGHVGPAFDMDVGVKRKDEFAEWLAKDPIQRTRAELLRRGLTDDELVTIAHAIDHEIHEAVRLARAAPYPHPAELLNHVFVAGEDR